MGAAYLHKENPARLSQNQEFSFSGELDLPGGAAPNGDLMGIL